MRHESLGCPARRARAAGLFATLAAGLLATLAAAPCAAQTPVMPDAPAAPPAPAAVSSGVPSAMAADDASALARLAVAIAEVRDSAQKQLALGRNKTPQAQQQLRSQAATQVAALLRRAGLTEGEYRRRTYLVSTDSAARRAYDAAVARLTGANAPDAPGTAGAAAVPPAAPS